MYRYSNKPTSLTREQVENIRTILAKRRLSQVLAQRNAILSQRLSMMQGMGKPRRRSYGFKLSVCRELSKAKVQAIAKRHNISIRNRYGEVMKKDDLCRKLKSATTKKGKSKSRKIAKVGPRSLKRLFKTPRKSSRKGSIKGSRKCSKKGSKNRSGSKKSPKKGSKKRSGSKKSPKKGSKKRSGSKKSPKKGSKKRSGSKKMSRKRSSSKKRKSRKSRSGKGKKRSGSKGRKRSRKPKGMLGILGM